MWQDGPPASGDELTYALRGLPLAAAALQIGVHPDDEDVGTVAYLARGVGARTVYWSATRGEGGQNRVGRERAEALGVLRTWESLAARRVDGAEVLYGPFYDFGFSKSPRDTFARWPRDELVREVARAIRLIQPLVVISRWTGGPTDGHGQHQAIGQVVRDAWDAAADPAALPELELPAWQPRKLYRSLGGDWQPGENDTAGLLVPEHDAAGYLRIDTGTVDAVSGRSFQELGHLAVNQHRTQGIAMLPQRGPYYYYYRRELTLDPPVDPETDFYDGLEPRLRRLADHPGGGAPALREPLVRAEQSLQEAQDTFEPSRPHRAGPALLEGLRALEQARSVLPDTVPDASDRTALERYLDRRIQDAGALAGRCLGLRLECLLDRHHATPGDRVRARARVWTDGAVDARVAAPSLELPRGWTAETVSGGAAAEPGVAAGAEHEITIGGQRWAASTYWLREPRRPYRYVWPRRGPLSLPLDPPLVHATAEVEVGERRLRLRTAGHHRRAVPGGVGALPLTVLPAIALEPRERRLLLQATEEPRTLDLPVLVRCLRSAGQTGRVALACPVGWTADPMTTEVALEHADETRTIPFEVTVPAGARPGAHPLRYFVATGAAPYGVELEPVRLGLGPAPPNAATCVAETFVTRPSTVTVHVVDVEFVAGHRYAYIPGFDEEVRPSLAAFGLDVTTLSGEDIAFTELESFDAIVVGPNAYNARPAVRAGAARLLDYVALGGTLIVQYQTYGYDAEGLAPYPFAYNQPHDRVTLRDATVQALAPDHPVLNVPNPIGKSDWEEWVHDRGMYFFGRWDHRYTPILASADPGEEPRRGGLMVAAHGRGTYVYTGYSFHRQIPAGVRGAIRLFANLLALAETRMRDRAQRLRRVDVLAFLTDAELTEVARSVGERWVDAGTVLARQGEPGAGIVMAPDTELEVARENGDGTRTMRIVAPGEVLGGFSVLLEEPSPVTVRTRAPGPVLELEGETLRQWLRREPERADRLIRALASELVRRGG